MNENLRRWVFVQQHQKALIMVDVQKAFEHEKWGERNNLDAEKNISRLLTFWREKGWTVIHIQHTSDQPHSLFHPANEGHSFKEIAKPLDEETVIQKKVNSSFIGTNLEEQLRSNEIDTVVIAGLTTPHCVSTTTRMSGNLGFDTYLMSDATAAFGLTDQTGTYYDPETIHRLSLATLHDEFATVLTTEQLITNWASESS
ncbi:MULTISPECIES: cysteine hydrolase family protein [Bacillus]|uniref:cysteine hydrolase family protein n=1 Tax=Bacillus TaxID=1386 RepID=UPI00227ED0B2|nr:cysteine hydrolase family protein [Bacillus altitudinis]MCY7439132.1 cysteine hydrolase [Bacillus altitudinis]MEC1143568.1 cysteine hydrolase family protein [Bacillus altitudinis]